MPIHLKKISSLFVTSLMFVILSSSARADSHTIKMKSLSYDPKTIEIKVGDSIEWTNEAYTEHSATSVDATEAASKFDTGLIQPKKTSKKITFKTPGTVKYHCIVHGPMMHGTITVTP